MAGLINDEDVRALREKVNIADVVGDHTALRRSGSRLKGLCPFHDERTPSFHVDPVQGYYHCFGCDASGDVYSFLQQAEALSFPEAVERLARMVGHTLRYEELSPGQRRALGRRTRLAEVMAIASSYYVEQLHRAGGRTAREYLAQRGLGRRELEQFRIGWAPDSWDGLVRHLTGQRVDPREAIDAGLARKGRHGPIDFFRGRVLFPIFDPSGKDVLAFGGRTVPGVELSTAGQHTPPKYINSVETELYKKSRTLYGLNWARADIARRDTALVVEGYMDVIGLHAAGVGHAVATCGTALTGDHFAQLKKFARRVVLALDADEAGLAAAERARELAEGEGVEQVGVLPLPEGEDPADLANRGADAVEDALRRTQTSVEFQLVHLLRTADVSTPEAQASAYRRTFGLLARLDDRVLRYRYIRDVVAPAVRLSADRIEAELDRHLSGRGADPAAGDRQTRVPAGQGRGEEPKPGRATPAATTSRPPSPARLDPQLRLERQVLQAALKHPELLPDDFAELSGDEFTNAASQGLFTAIRASADGRLATILPSLPDDETRARVRALALADSEFPAEPGKIAALVTELRGRSVQRRIEEVLDRLRGQREQLDASQRRALLADHARLNSRLRELTERSRP